MPLMLLNHLLMDLLLDKVVVVVEVPLAEEIHQLLVLDKVAEMLKYKMEVI